MVSICRRVVSAAVLAGPGGGFVGTIGAGFGYVYAKLNDLPTGQVAKAWAVWSAATTALHLITQAFIENRVHKIIAAIITQVSSVTIGIQECRKRGLLEDKMLGFIIAINTIFLASPIISLCCVYAGIDPASHAEQQE